MTEPSDIAVVGLGVMGANLALNLAEKGHRVAVYNRTASVTEEFMAGTDPRLNTSALRLEAVQGAAGALLRFTAQADRAYTVQVRSHLTADSWQSFSSFPTQSMSRVIEIPVPDADSTAQQWFRVVTPPAL